MKPTREQLIEALYNEYMFLIHDDFDPDVDPTPEEYLDSIKDLSYDDLIDETQTDDHFTIDEFLEAYC